MLTESHWFSSHRLQALWRETACCPKSRWCHRRPPPHLGQHPTGRRKINKSALIDWLIHSFNIRSNIRVSGLWCWELHPWVILYSAHKGSWNNSGLIGLPSVSVGRFHIIEGSASLHVQYSQIDHEESALGASWRLIEADSSFSLICSLAVPLSAYRDR